MESRPTQSSQRPSRVTQAAAAAARPLKPGFWKAMKLPAKDPPLGGIRVRADMGADTFQACLHCLDTKHKCALPLHRRRATRCTLSWHPLKPKCTLEYQGTLASNRPALQTRPRSV